MTPRRAALQTGWIAIIATFLITWIPLAIWVLIDSLGKAADNGDSFGDVLVKAFPGSFLALLMFGFYIWAMISVSIIALDIFLFKNLREQIRIRLLIEWGVISAVLVAAAILDSFGMYAMPVIPLLLAQLYRERRMKQLIDQTPDSTEALMA